MRRILAVVAIAAASIAVGIDAIGVARPRRACRLHRHARARIGGQPAGVADRDHADARRSRADPGEGRRGSSPAGRRHAVRHRRA